MARQRTPKTKSEKLAAKPWDEVLAMGTEELRSAIRTMRAGYNRRKTAIRAAGLFSHALSRARKNFPGTGIFKVEKLQRNQLLKEYNKYIQFFGAKTSTVKGIKDVNLKQDKRLFGTRKDGKPLKRMTEKQREKYWDLYDEYNNQKPADIYMYSSDRIQTVLADVFKKRKGRKPRDLSKFFDELRLKIQQDYEDWENSLM